MPSTVRGVRSVDIEMSDPVRAAQFYCKIWNLTEVDAQTPARSGSAAPGATITSSPSIRRARAAALRRLVFDAATKDIVQALHAEGRA